MRRRKYQAVVTCRSYWWSIEIPELHLEGRYDGVTKPRSSIEVEEMAKRLIASNTNLSPRRIKIELVKGVSA